MYAVIEAGGKQHKVEVGQVLEVDLMQEESGSDHAFENVMLYVDGEDVQIGQPFIENAKVIACLLYTSPSPRDGLLSRMPSSA